MKLNKIEGNIVFKHPTKEFEVIPTFTEDAIVLTIKYTDGTIATRYEYKDKPSEIYVNKPFRVNLDTGEATIINE